MLLRLLVLLLLLLLLLPLLLLLLLLLLLPLLLPLLPAADEIPPCRNFDIASKLRRGYESSALEN